MLIVLCNRYRIMKLQHTGKPRYHDTCHHQPVKERLTGDHVCCRLNLWSSIGGPQAISSPPADRAAKSIFSFHFGFCCAWQFASCRLLLRNQLDSTVVMITDLHAGDWGLNPSRDKTSSSKARPLMIYQPTSGMSEQINNRVIPAQTSPESTRSASVAREPGQTDGGSMRNGLLE